MIFFSIEIFTNNRSYYTDLLDNYVIKMSIKLNPIENN